MERAKSREGLPENVVDMKDPDIIKALQRLAGSIPGPSLEASQRMSDRVTFMIRTETAKLNKD